MSEISIVILTYNSIRFILSCLDSVFSQDYQNFEVAVIDNGSKDGTIEFIKKHYSRVNLIGNKKNLGAARARNQGIEISKGKWILTLDCDAILEKNFLSKIFEFADKSEVAIGMIQPKILKTDKKTIYSCGIHLSKLRRFYDIGKGRIDNGKFDKTRYIFGACSAVALYKRQMLEKIKEKTGYFDERFFFLVEDVDLAWRAQRKGWKGIFLPEAKCYHYGNSSCFDKRLRQYFCFRNRHLLIFKNERRSIALIKTPFYLIYGLPRFILLAKYIKNNRQNNQKGGFYV